MANDDATARELLQSMWGHDWATCSLTKVDCELLAQVDAYLRTPQQDATARELLQRALVHGAQYISANDPTLATEIRAYLNAPQQADGQRGDGWTIADDGTLNIWFEERWLPASVRFFGSELHKTTQFNAAVAAAVRNIRALKAAAPSAGDALREALRPLAALDIDARLGQFKDEDDTPIVGFNDTRITIGDVKRARAALSESTTGGEGDA